MDARIAKRKRCSLCRNKTDGRGLAVENNPNRQIARQRMLDDNTHKGLGQLDSRRRQLKYLCARPTKLSQMCRRYEVWYHNCPDPKRPETESCHPKSNLTVRLSALRMC